MTQGIIQRAHRVANMGDPEAVERGILELEAELEVARSAWAVFDHPSWVYLCKFWDNKVQRLLRQLRRADLAGHDLGFIQGQLAAYESMLTAKETFASEAKEVKDCLTLLRNSQTSPQNTREQLGDPDIQKLVAEDRKDRQQRFNGA